MRKPERGGQLISGKLLTLTRKAMDPRIEQSILAMATRFRDPLTLAELATGVGLSPFHFHRIFKAETRETPANYLARIRLDHAAHLMVVLPDAPLLQIAFESGFSSAAVFARCFRLRYQETASEFRRRKELVVSDIALPHALSLHRLPVRKLSVERCPLDEDALSAAHRRLQQRCGEKRSAALGVFVDAPFHQDRSTCRHYVALEDDPCLDPTRAFLLPGGLYARLRVTGDIDSLSRAILRFKSGQLDPSPYGIGSTLAFERIEFPETGEAFDYRRSERDVFIKVRRKNEPVI